VFDGVEYSTLFALSGTTKTSGKSSGRLELDIDNMAFGRQYARVAIRQSNSVHKITIMRSRFFISFPSRNTALYSPEPHSSSLSILWGLNFFDGRFSRIFCTLGYGRLLATKNQKKDKTHKRK